MKMHSVLVSTKNRYDYLRKKLYKIETYIDKFFVTGDGLVTNLLLV